MGWTFPTSVIDFTAGLATTGSWANLDMTPDYVPAGTRTVWCRIHKTGNVFPKVGLASGGITSDPDNRLMNSVSAFYYLVGLTSDGVLRYYVSNTTTIAFEILGYTDDVLTFPEGAVTTWAQQTPAGTGWRDLTLSSIPDDAVFGVLLANNNNNGTAYQMDFRDDGSADEDLHDIGASCQSHYFIPVTSKVGEVYSEDLTYQKYYLVGWLADGWNKISPPAAVTLSSVSAWEEADLSALLPANATIALFDIVNGDSADKIAAYRSPASSENITSYVNVFRDSRVHGMMDCTNRKIDFYRSDADIYVQLIGYWADPDVSVTLGSCDSNAEAANVVDNKIVNAGFDAGTAGLWPDDWSDSVGVMPNLSVRLAEPANPYSHCRPTVANGYFYVMTVLGTTDAAEPVWPTTIGATVEDGDAEWTCAGLLDCETVVDDEVGRGGGRSLKFAGPGWEGVNQSISVTPGRRYRAGCWIKADSVDLWGGETWNNNVASNFSMTVTMVNSVSGSRIISQFNQYGIRTHDWQFWYLGDFVAVTNDTSLLFKMQAALGDASTVWIDDFLVWEDDGAPVKTPLRSLIHSDANYGMFWAHQQDDVFQADALPSGDPVTEVDVHVVANERVSWQLAVNPAAEWTNVTWDITDFTDGVNTIPASSVNVKRVEFVDVGSGPAAGENDDFMKTGTAPDPLPVEASSTLASEENNPFFFTVHVPSDAVAGTYTGTITLVKDGVDQASVDINLVVADYMLPLEPVIRSECGMYWDLLPGATNTIMETNFWNHRSFKNGHSHLPYANYSADPAPHFSFDSALNDDWETECIALAALPGHVPSMNLVYTAGINMATNEFQPGFSHNVTVSIVDGEGDPTEDFLFYFPIYLRDLMAYYESLGITKVSLRHRDEISNNGSDHQIVKAVQEAIKATGLNIETVGNDNPNPEWPDYIDTFYLGSAFFPGWNDVNYEFQKPGIYANPFMNFCQNYPAVKMRMYVWALYQDGLKAHQFWTINAGTGDPWAGDYDYFTLIYPPRDGVDPAGVPIDSVRWEAFRQGLQDADLSWILHDLIETKGPLVLPAVRAAAQAALDRVEEVVTHTPVQSQDAAIGCQYDQFCSFDLELIEEVRKGVVDNIIALRDAEIIPSGGSQIRSRMFIGMEMEF